jgi:L-lysine 2,3-aminomutase
MRDAVTAPEELLRALGLGAELLAAARAAAATFGLRVPRSYLRRIRPGDPGDPLLRQVLPLGAELAPAPGFVSDPVDEQAALRAPSLLQKYAGRALIITTSVCAVHCRYCFRREFPYSEAAEGLAGGAPAPASLAGRRFSEALDEIAGDPTIEEVILSGGDPLSLSDERLASLTTALSAMPHIQRIRLHTRTPIVLPSRVDEGLSTWLRSVRRPLVVVLHANHPNEIDDDVLAACTRLRASGAVLFNQSVLLQGVNDDPEVLAALSRRLFEVGVLPYYLHVLDRVRGAAHFDVAEERAQEIAGQLAALLPGYLVPRLVRERPGQPAKVPLPPRF